MAIHRNQHSVINNMGFQARLSGVTFLFFHRLSGNKCVCACVCVCHTVWDESWVPNYSRTLAIKFSGHCALFVLRDRTSLLFRR
jgi:hypothetical protein